MLLYEPPPTPADLHFRLLGVPVRVSPMFWVVTGLMALNRGRGTPPADFVIWVAVVFVSIVVHEMGHALLQRRYGGTPRVTLHAVGGIASCDDGDPRPSSQILISLAGPAAGFALALLAVMAVRLSGHLVGWTSGGDVSPDDLGVDKAYQLPVLGGGIYWEALGAYSANKIFANVLAVNILWGLINLLPVYPLDGGRVSRELCTLWRPRQGIILSLRISMVVAMAMSAFAFLAWRSFYTALLFGYLAYSSYNALRAYQSHRRW
ncbi:MAG TPA: site-2 protease family protein [Lacipirellulaceae bacterium]|nr:site-2 protease family protein [Lacipirellulaceae bacterium]